jgi:hypothetical protein
MVLMGIGLGIIYARQARRVSNVFRLIRYHMLLHITSLPSSPYLYQPEFSFYNLITPLMLEFKDQQDYVPTKVHSLVS